MLYLALYAYVSNWMGLIWSWHKIYPNWRPSWPDSLPVEYHLGVSNKGKCTKNLCEHISNYIFNYCTKWKTNSYQITIRMFCFDMIYDTFKIAMMHGCVYMWHGQFAFNAFDFFFAIIYANIYIYIYCVWMLTNLYVIIRRMWYSLFGLYRQHGLCSYLVMCSYSQATQSWLRCFHRLHSSSQCTTIRHQMQSQLLFKCWK